ncbi:MAG: iron-containing alcohol dehydrogenase [Anaerolineae bacterium]
MSPEPVFEYLMPTRIIHGLGSLSRLGPEIRGLEVKRALIVTDAGIRAAGLIDRAVASLTEAGVESVIFDEIGHDAAVSVVDRGGEVARAEKCDGVVAMGGGSALSGGKAIAIMATNPGSIADYEGGDKVELAPLPVIAVPTTAGSGSEVSQAMPMKHDVQKRKMSVRSPLAYPKVAILDATLLPVEPVDREQ